MFRSPRFEHVAALIAAALVYCSMASVPRAGGMENDGLPGAVAERRVDYAGEYTRTDGTPIYVASRATDGGWHQSPISRKRFSRTLAANKGKLRRRRHGSLGQTGCWLSSVVR